MADFVIYTKYELNSSFITFKCIKTKYGIYRNLSLVEQNFRRLFLCHSNSVNFLEIHWWEKRLYYFHAPKEEPFEGFIQKNYCPVQEKLVYYLLITRTRIKSEH